MKTKFLTWLFQQANRDDFVGDLAKDVKRFKNHPHGNSGYSVWLEHVSLHSNRNREVIEAFEEAWKQYEASQD